MKRIELKKEVEIDRGVVSVMNVCKGAHCDRAIKFLEVNLRDEVREMSSGEELYL